MAKLKRRLKFHPYLEYCTSLEIKKCKRGKVQANISAGFRSLYIEDRGRSLTSEALAPSEGRVKRVLPLPHKFFLLNRR